MTVLPRRVPPMLALLRPSLPKDDERWGFELKWDGVRAVAYVEGGRVALMSRNDKDMAHSYPELAVLAGRVDEPVVLDGEIVALRAGRPDHQGRPTRSALGGRSARASPRRLPSPRVISSDDET